MGAAAAGSAAASVLSSRLCLPGLALLQGTAVVGSGGGEVVEVAVSACTLLGCALLHKTADIGVCENFPSESSASTPTHAVERIRRYSASGWAPIWLANSSADLGPLSRRSGIPSCARQYTAPATCAPFKICRMPTCGGGACSAAISFDVVIILPLSFAR